MGLIVCFMFLFAILIAGISYFINEKNVIRQVSLLGDNASEEIEESVSNVSRLSTQIFLDAGFQENLTHLNEIDGQSYYDRIYGHFATSVIFSPLVSGVFYCPFDSEGNIVAENFVFLGATDSAVFGSVEAFNRAAAEEGNRRGRLLALECMDERILLFSRVVLGSLPDNLLKPIGFGVIVVNKNQLFSPLGNLAVLGVDSYIVGGEGEIIYPTEFSEKKNPEHYKVYNSVDYFGWNISNVYSFHTVLNFYGSTLQLFAFSVIGVALLSFVCMFAVAYKGTREHYAFINTFNQIEKGDLNAKIPYGKDKDVNLVAERFNSMMESIKTLNEEIVRAQTCVLQTEVEKNEYVLKFLNSQINKHFIFNTFGLIRSLVRSNRRNTALECIDDMCEVMRYALVARDSVYLSEEIQSLQAYFNLQHRRMPGIRVELDIPENCLGELIPKFILQPIVENCYAHGFETDSGTVKVSVREGEKSLVVTVEDDGAGVSEERLREIRENLGEGAETSGDSLALGNILRRLKLIVSEGSSLQVESEEGKWFRTTVIVARQEVVKDV